MYLIKWRNRSTLRVITGLSRYTTYAAAEKQVAKFKSHFHMNSYYIEWV